MRKLIVLLALLIAMSLAIAAESAPSATVGYIKSSLVTTPTTNLNLISYGLDANAVMASDLGALIGPCNEVSKWDPSVQGWITASNLGPFWGGNFNINPGDALMVNITTDKEFYLAGKVVDTPDYSLITTSSTNLNLISIPFDKANLAMASDLGADIGPCSDISKWDPSVQGWNTASNLGPFWGGNFALETAMPLIVNVTAGIVWPSAK